MLSFLMKTADATKRFDELMRDTVDDNESDELVHRKIRLMMGFSTTGCDGIDDKVMKQGQTLWDDYSDDDSMTDLRIIKRIIWNYLQDNTEFPASKSVIEDGLKTRIESGDNDPALSASGAVLKEKMGKCGGCDGSEFDVDADGSFRFYILDAYEVDLGVICLFGKVKMGDAYKSCCVVVKSSLRCVYAIPNDSIFPPQEVIMLEQEVKDSRLSPDSFRDKLHFLAVSSQEMASKLKNEVSHKLFLLFKVTDISMTPVKRNFAFERPDVPAGEQYVLKIKYPFVHPPLREDLKGESFRALHGCNTSALELFIRKKKIMGPCWLKISDFSPYTPSERASWCKFEVTVESPEAITVLDSEEEMDHPPILVTAINLKTMFNEKQNTSEIVSASAVCFHNAKIDVPMPVTERKRCGVVSHFTVVRNPEGTCYPTGWLEEVADSRRVLFSQKSERELLIQLFIELFRLESDVFVGRNISGFDLDVLVQRSHACQVPILSWSKIGRRNGFYMPEIEGNSSFGAGGLKSCMAGRLLCDTNLCSRDLLNTHQVSYSLTDFSKTHLNLDRKEITPSDIPKMFQSSKTHLELIECGENDAWLCMKLMFHLSALPLTLQLTNMSGNLWGKTLQISRPVPPMQSFDTPPLTGATGAALGTGATDAAQAIGGYGALARATSRSSSSNHQKCS
ncbi:unnamed protein product [Microthlaspi erraticum]|uniref:DNA-directed DNA polymerase family B exonuclease domain-containing protein n=1 Tax=Microthlaspi erraticum TaxID=1685480 RepID=A0A6D2HEW6_9BRAS|nr:unnamed protein product [Microthlaspi erraticum]